MKRAILFLVSIAVLAGTVQPRAVLAATNPQDIHTEHMPPLFRAAEAGRTDEVRRLIESGANVNEEFPERGFTPLMLASLRAHVEIVKLLLKAGADPNADGVITHGVWFTPLTLAIRGQRKNRLEVVDTLIAGGAHLNPPPSSDESPFDAALAVNDIEMMRELLKRGSDVNWQDEFGRTPLENAVTRADRNVKVVGFLLKAGADPNKPAMWNGKDCESIRKYLDDYVRTSPRDKATKEIRRLIIRAGGKSFVKKSRGELCKPASLIN